MITIPCVRKSESPCKGGALTLNQLGLMAGLFGVLALTVQAAQPSWWATRGAIDSNPKNDNAVVTQGQLKKFTYEGVQELNANLSGGAGSTLNTMTQGWSNYYHSYGVSSNDYAIMNVGQLKQIASLVYPPLVSAGYPTSRANVGRSVVEGENEHPWVFSFKQELTLHCQPN